MVTTVCSVLAFATTAIGIGFNNSWIDSNGKWESGANWSQTVAPSSVDPADFITNTVTKTVTIDATTVLSNVLNGCLTISNLTVSAPLGSTNTLFLNNAGGSIPLDILNSLTITTNAAVLVTNSALIVNNLSGGVFNVDGSLVLYNGGSIMATSNSLIVASTANVTGAVWITGGQLTATNNLTYVAYSGIGTWTVSNGLWQAQLVRIGYTSGARGTLTMAGGTNVLSGNLNMGYFAGAKGTIWLTGGELLVTNGAAFVGYGSSGQMTVSNGTWRGNIAYVGENTGSQGTLTLAGGISSLASFLEVGGSIAATGAVWLTGGELDTTNATSYVGDGGVGQMTVSNGLWLSQSIRVGTTNIAQGTLTIAGGTVTLSPSPVSFLSLGYQTYSATDTIWVTGGRLIATNSSTTINIGDSGVGQMVVSNGIVSASTVHIGTILNFGQSYPTPVGGTLTIAGGTMSVSSLLDVSRVPNATSTVWVTGGQLNVNNTPLVVGVLGLARMTVSNGTVNVGELVVTNNLSGSVVNTNLLSFVGGTINSAGAAITNGVAFDIGDGVHPATYQLAGGVHSFADGLRVRTNALLSGCGTISGIVVFDAGSTVAADCGGNLNFTGTITNNTTVLAINGTTVNFFGPVINNSVINAVGGSAHFYSTVQNNGTLLGASLTNSWTDGSAKWETAGDWSLGSRPAATDLADAITNAGSKTVTIDASTVSNAPASMTISNLLVSSVGPGTNTLSLNNAGLTIPLHVGGQLSLSNNGAVIVNNMFLQVDGGFSDGVSPGSGNQLIVSNGGRFVSGTAVVGAGASTGNNVLVTGAGSIWVNTNGALVVDNSSAGTAVKVANGASVVASVVYVGDGCSSDHNVVLVTDPGTTWTNLVILNVGGCSTSDQFILSNGASLYTTNAIIGNAVGNSHSVVVTGSNSTWTTDGSIHVGNGSTGDSLTVTAGGTLIASNASHTAEVVVDGATLLLGDGTFTPDNLVITNGGLVQYTATYPVNNGTITVANGTVQAGSNLTVAATANSTGTVNVVGGTLVVTNGVVGIGNNGTITSGSGVAQVSVSNGTLLASSIVVGNTNGSQCDLFLTDGGVISDGGCPGGTNCQIVINSLGFQQTNGTVQACSSQMELGITGPGDTTVSGTGASDNFQYLYAGYSNVGTFTLAGGAVNVCAQFVVGHEGLDVGSVIATGAVWVTGGQLTMNSGDSIIGNSGVGQMNISNGVVTAANVTVGNSANPSSFGTLTLAGGTLTMSSLVLPNPRSRFVFTGGCLNTPGMTNSNGQLLTLGNGVSPITFNLLGGISFFGTGLKLSTNTTLSGFGTVTGNAANYGLISPGSGVLNFTGGVLTNYGTMLATAGGGINFYSQVVNNGLILTNGGVHFMGGLINNGLLLDPMADSDGDGMNNQSEALAGTNPMNSASFFHIKTIAAVGVDVQVSWSAVGGKGYVVQTAPVSAGGFTNSYSDLSFVITAPGTGETTMSYTDLGAAAGPPRFYRIRLGP